jgi:hypothetical protein
MELQGAECAGAGQAGKLFVIGIDDHGDAIDMGRDGRSERAHLVGFDMARAFGEMDEADMARPGAHGGAHRLRRGQAADLDRDSGHGPAFRP